MKLILLSFFLSLTSLNMSAQSNDELDGCTNEFAINYNQSATVDDGTCLYDCGQGETCTEEDAILGCLDSNFWNYNYNANVTDYSCHYLHTQCSYGAESFSFDCYECECIPGFWCPVGMEEVLPTWAYTCNQLPDSLCVSSGIPNIGCGDSLAINFIPNIQVNNEVCYYDPYYFSYTALSTININTNIWAAEISLEILDSNGDIAESVEQGDLSNTSNYTYNVSLIQGETYQVIMMDAFGDGWNGATIEILICNPQITLIDSGLVSGLTDTLVFTVPSCDGSVYGCVDSLAVNYNNLATENNGTCEYEQLQEIVFQENWNLFSSYIQTDNMNVEFLLSPFVEDVIIVKDNIGIAYLPNFDFNGIGELTIGQAYQAKLTSAHSITLEGEYMKPEENPITLTAGWNMVGYLRIHAATPTQVFEYINDLVIVKDNLGMAYLPEYNFDGIGNMQPGQGYQVKVLNQQVLYYRENSVSYE